jgi:hypothetical protein
VVEVYSEDGAWYWVVVWGFTDSGTVMVSLPAGVVRDVAGNLSLVATSTDNVVAYKPWTNWFLPYDVTGDDHVTAVDVLYVIDYINSNVGDPRLPPPPEDGTEVFYDVDGNELVTANDALLAIDYINNPPLGVSEGEAGVEPGVAEPLARSPAVAERPGFGNTVEPPCSSSSLSRGTGAGSTGSARGLRVGSVSWHGSRSVHAPDPRPQGELRTAPPTEPYVATRHPWAVSGLLSAVGEGPARSVVGRPPRAAVDAILEELDACLADLDDVLGAIASDIDTAWQARS